jgi:hypothetical protein
MSINICELCYVLEVPECQASYSVLTGISHVAFHWMHLEDEHGNVFVQKGKTLQPDGKAWVIHTADYPAGMFTAASGSYTLTWSSTSDINTPDTLEIGGKQYPCIILNFYDNTVLADMT